LFFSPNQIVPMKHHVLSIQTPFQKLSGSPFRILISLAVLLANIGMSMAATINVPGVNGPTIQAAVNAAVAGDIILVAPGTYNENVTISKSLTLISSGGAGSTIINGSPVSLGTILISSGVNDVTVGGSGKGFTIEGYDNPNGAVENAAVYIQGTHSGITIQGNTIVADGEGGLLTEFNANVTNLKVIENIFSGQTYSGSEPGGCGFATQFDNPTTNTPRQLVVISQGASNVLFSNNQLTGAAGGTSSTCTPFGQGNTLATIDANNTVICGNNFAGTTARFATHLRARGTNVSVKNNTFNSSGLIGDATYHIFFGSTSITGGNPNTIAGVAQENIFTTEGWYFTGSTNIYKSSAQVSAQSGSPAPIAANSAPIANTSCPTCLNTTPPDLFTAYPGDSRVPAGQQSATVCQNSGNVTFQFSNCIGGTVNWSGTDGSNGTGNIIASSANVGTVTYSATCTIGQCISAASQVSVTTNAPPVVSISGNTSVVFGYGSNCTTLTAQPTGNGPFTYIWKSGNMQIGTSASQQVCPAQTTTYSVTVTDANGCSTNQEVTVYVKDVRCGNKNQNVQICYYGVTQCVSEKIAKNYLRLGATLGACGSGSNSPARIGVEESASDSPFELSVKGYPNPTQGELTVEVMSKISGSVQMQVLDLTGRAVQQRSEQLLEGRNEVKFDLRAQPSGNYLIRAVDGLNRQGVVRVNKQ
jgi:hypothetical protein